jgi:hypothetical protein
MITRSIRERVEEKEAQACFLRDVQELTKRLALAGPNTFSLLGHSNSGFGSRRCTESSGHWQIDRKHIDTVRLCTCW